MTVTTLVSKKEYVANGTDGEQFAVPFPFLADDHLTVYSDDGDSLTLHTLGVDYTVSGAGSASGTVTWIGSPGEGDTITIQRWLDPVQEKAYPEHDKFPAKSHEEALDILTMLVQQIFSLFGGSQFSFDQLALMTLTEHGWDALSHRIINLADPDASQLQHAATVGHVLSVIAEHSAELPGPLASQVGQYLKAVDEGVANWADLPGGLTDPGASDVGKFLKAVAEGEADWTELPAWIPEPAAGDEDKYLVAGGASTATWQDLPDFLLKSGGTMSGAIDMDGAGIENLAPATADSDAARRGDVRAAIQPTGSPQSITKATLRGTGGWENTTGKTVIVYITYFWNSLVKGENSFKTEYERPNVSGWHQLGRFKGGGGEDDRGTHTLIVPPGGKVRCVDVPNDGHIDIATYIEFGL